MEEESRNGRQFVVREVDVGDQMHRDDVVVQKRAAETGEGDVLPHEVVSFRDFQRRAGVKNIESLLVSFEAAVVQALVGQLRELNMGELWDDFERVLGKEVVSHDVMVAFDELHRDGVAEVSQVSEDVGTAALDGPIHHLQRRGSEM